MKQPLRNGGRISHNELEQRKRMEAGADNAEDRAPHAQFDASTEYKMKDTFGFEITTIVDWRCEYNAN